METVAPWMSTNNLIGRERFGIALDDPTVTAPAKCRYDACVQSDAKEMLSGDPGRKVIPGGKYAALAFEGTGDGIGAAWEALLRDWLPKSGLQLDSRPFFEHYPVDGRYDPKTGQLHLQYLRAGGDRSMGQPGIWQNFRSCEKWWS